MKNIIIFSTILFLVTVSCKAQIKTYLTLTEYDNIQVDGVKWRDIGMIKGDLSKVKSLFNSEIKHETNNEPNPNIGFWDKGFYFGFEDRSGDGSYSLTDFWIDNNSSTITIKGNTFTVGDDKSKLGNIKPNTYPDGSKGYIFALKGTDSSGFFIKYNPSTNIITEIKFIDFD